MPGSGINEENIQEIARKTVLIDLSARLPVESGMKFRNSGFSMGGENISIDEYKMLIQGAGTC